MSTGTKKKGRKLTGVHPGIWCWLLTPNTQFSEDGEYSVDMLMPEADAKQLFLQIQQEATDWANEIRREEKYRDWKMAWPIKDYDGEEDQYKGMKVVAFRQKVKPGFNFKVDVFDAHKNPIDPKSGLRIGNGTKLRICYHIRVVADSLNKCIRVLFHPVAAQIIDLVPWESDYGFDDSEGYSVDSPSPKRIEDMRPKPGTPDDPFQGGQPEFKEDEIPF